jgi:threonine dehydratase
VHSVRVLIGALPAPLQEAVSAVVARDPHIELVGLAATPSELLAAAGELDAEVVVVATVDSALPGVATHLLDQYPDIRVVAVAPEGSAALVYSLQPHTDRFSGSSVAGLAESIRAAWHQPA